MIELKKDNLVFSFPEVHKEAVLRIDFQRTLRIPDDGDRHALPPGLGSFPLRHVDDFGEKVPEEWLEHGGVMLPMYQSEALWLNFGSGWGDRYPFALKVATGKINAVTGKPWENGLNRKPQDYIVVPEQPWLDGYCVKEGEIRQFVAMPLGAGYTAEEQITGEAEHGGIQIIAYPMRREAYERLRKTDRRQLFGSGEDHLMAVPASAKFSLGLSPGGRMRQKIYKDKRKFDVWDLENASRCFVHIANSMVWRAITGKEPPTVPPTSKEYTDMGLPWFDLYDEHMPALDGSGKLADLKSVKQLGEEKGDVPLPENESVDPKNVKKLRHGLKKNQVREGIF